MTTNTETLTESPAKQAQPCPQMPEPAQEHAWLQRFVGEWATEAQMFMEPGQPPTKATGDESCRSLGGFWVVADGESNSPEMPFSYRLTLGYDPEKKKYIGTWVDSMSSYLWKYEGAVDATGKTLTLETTGPSPTMPGKMIQFREATEFISQDQRRFNSSMQGEDGKWSTLLIVNYQRKR